MMPTTEKEVVTPIRAEKTHENVNVYMGWAGVVLYYLEQRARVMHTPFVGIRVKIGTLELTLNI